MSIEVFAVEDVASTPKAKPNIETDDHELNEHSYFRLLSQVYCERRPLRVPPPDADYSRSDEPHDVLL